jgi:hypothetical protein
LEDCQVRITWQTPQENGSAINYYILLIHSVDGEFKTLSHTDCPHSATETSCLVNLDVFSGAPFNLNQGNPIIPKMSAVSDAG